MSRTKVAPVLRQTIRNSLGPTGDVYEERGWRAMDRELRALLAVASAAERHVAWLNEVTPPEDAQPTDKAIIRAVNRLSSPPSRRTARTERKTR